MSQWVHWVPVFISPVLECIIRIDMLSNWQNPHVGSQTYIQHEGCSMGRAKWKPLELPPPTKMVKQKQSHVLGGISQTSTILKMFVMLEGWFHSTHQFDLTDGSWAKLLKYLYFLGVVWILVIWVICIIFEGFIFFIYKTELYHLTQLSRKLNEMLIWTIVI